MSWPHGGLPYNPNAGEAPSPQMGQALNDAIEMLWLGYTAEWVAASPSVSGFTVGNGTATGKVQNIHGRAHCRFVFTVGSTTSMPGIGQTFTIANFAPADMAGVFVGGVAGIFDTSSGYWHPTTVRQSGSNLTIPMYPSPVTWGTGDQVVANWTSRIVIDPSEITQ